MAFKFLPYTPTSKVDCPKCGKKKRFSLFYDTDSGEVMPTEFGRCDREEGCGYYKHPTGGAGKKEYAKPIEQVPQKYIDKNIVAQTMANNQHNAFLFSLKEKFGEKSVNDAIKKYYIGTSKTNGTAYFCVNHKKLVTSCKVVTYKGFNRDKSVMPYYPFLTSDGYYPCLFGQHLVDNNKKIKIVEAEKTALIASIVYPEIVWLSPGGATNMTAAKCAVFKETKYPHPVDLIGDCSAAGRAGVKKWQENLGVFGIEGNIVELGEEYNDDEDLADLLLK